MSRSAIETRMRCGSCSPFIAPVTAPRIATAVGSSIATVAELEMKAESRHVIRPKAMIVLTVDVPTLGNARIR